MREFVGDDVFKTLDRFLDKFQVEPNPLRWCVTAPPLGLHLLDAPVGDFDTRHGLPLFQQRRNQVLELLPVPAQDDHFPLFRAGARAHEQVKSGDSSHGDSGWGIVLVDMKAIPLTEEVMTLVIDHLALWLPRLLLKLGFLSLDPPQFVDYCQSHGGW